jgi:hypothetical protein
MVRTCTIERVPVSYPQNTNTADQASNTLQPHNPKKLLITPTTSDYSCGFTNMAA